MDDIIPEMGQLVRCIGYNELAEVVSTNIGNSTFIGLITEPDGARQESFLFSQILEIVEQQNISQTLNLNGIGLLRVKLSRREEAQFIMARAGELAAQKSGFILGGTSAVKTKKEGN